MQTKQIVNQALKVSNTIGGGTGAFAERRAAQGADLMWHKTLLAERSQSAPAGRAPVPKPAAVAKARDACRQAQASAKIGRFVFCQTGRAELQPGRLHPRCANLLGPWSQGKTQPGTRADIIEFALEHEDLTPRELAVKYTDEKQYFVSESSVYRILKAEDLITAPAHIVMKAANEFQDKTTRPNELWQTD